MLLLVDAGNSRIKWRVVRGERRGRMRSAPLGATLPAALRADLARLPAAGRVVAVNVAGARFAAMLRRAVAGAGLAPPHLAASARSATGLRNGYRDAWRLGADRWVAMLGAQRFAGAAVPLCVADAGTALTVDVVDGSGAHRGGLIVPGPQLMIDSLLSGTRGIRRRAGGPAAPGRPRSATGWPRDTSGALAAGALEACAGAIGRSFAKARAEFGPATQLLVTGGAALPLMPLLPAPARHVPDLILLGLEVLAGDTPAPGAVR
jgi:type III pantothenate kinase